MSRLDPLAERRLGTAIRTLYELRSPGDCVQHFVRVIAGLIPGRGHACTVRDREGRVIYTGLEPATADHTRLLGDFLACYPQYPPLSHRQKTGMSEALTISDFATSREFQRTNLYQRYYRQLGLEDDVSVIFAHGGYRGCVGIGRERRNFLPQERSLLDALRLHFQQAFANAVAFAGAGMRVSGRLTTELEDNWQQGLIVVRTATQRIEHCTERSRKLLDFFFENEHRHAGSLPESLRQWLLRQEDQERGKLAPVVFRVSRDNRQLMVRCICDKEEGQSALLLEEKSRTWSAEGLRERGLSPRETEVLTWVAQGKTNQETAIILNIKPYTVKTHLENLYRKLGVENRQGAIFAAFNVEGVRGKG